MIASINTNIPLLHAHGVAIPKLGFGTGRIGALDTVTVRVGGRSHYSGEASFSVEPDDPLGGGFLLDRFAPPVG